MKYNKEEFLNIIESHKRLIYKIVNAYCQDKQNHQDLFQDIIMQLWSSFENYDEKYKLSTWIYRIALNTSISFHRKSIKRDAHIVDLPTILETTIKSEVSRIEDPKLETLNRFIQELREIDKALILLYLDGLSQKEISHVMGISATNVGTKLSRIKKILRNKFQNLN
ncbi:MAG: RNA polymerase sigma factor [Saprospiraceae bacterium]|nr:RNA polymerase sigma factor [Saprospiraceae bacterium]